MTQPQQTQVRTVGVDIANWVGKLDMLSFSAVMGLAAVLARLLVAVMVHVEIGGV